MHIAQESVQVLYDDEGRRQFIILGNGKLEWLRLSPATADDLKEVINAKPVEPL